MENKAKLEYLKKSLTENGFKYFVPKHNGEPGHSDLVIKGFKIVVKVNKDGEGDDPMFYERHKKHFIIIVIRDRDTLDYVVTKAQRAIIKSILHQQQHDDNKERKERNIRRALERKERKERHKERMSQQKNKQNL